MSIVFSEDHGRARHVVLNRPEKRNAMNQELLLALGETLREAAADSSVHCVVLRGEGPVFSAGVDLGELAESSGRPEMLRPFRAVFLECANLCESMAKPVVCQIHRTCVGGALEVALGCDLRVASSDAQLGLPEVRFGIIPDVGGSTRLPAVIGLGRAKELIMTARLIDAAEAERIGLVNRVVAPEELERATRELVEELLANSHVAVGRAKRVIDASARPALAQTLEMEVAVQEYCVAAARESARLEGEAQEALAGLEVVLGRAREAGLRCEAIISTSFGCPYEGHVAPERVLGIAARLGEAGAQELGFGDTTGMANPRQVREFFEQAPTVLGGEVELTAHFHNTRGQGLANVVAALQTGVESFESSFGELGGCPVPPGATGNIASEDLVSMLHEMGIETAIDLPALLACARRVQEILGRPLGSHTLVAGPVDWRG